MNRPPHACVPGCPALVPAGRRRCPEHTREHAVAERFEPDDGFYRSRAWKLLRAAWFATPVPSLGRVPVLCGDSLAGRSAEDSLCARRGRTTLGRVLDHVVPRDDGGADEPANFQSLCDRCHNVKRQREGVASSLAGRSRRSP